MRPILFSIFLNLCLNFTMLSATALAAPRVVTSIAPLQEVTAALMQGVTSPQSIITDNASTHHFALRPSHMRLLQQADLVIWIDRNFEAGFNRVAETLPSSVDQLEILPALGIDNDDGHIWYSPRLLQLLITIITTQLVEIDPQNQLLYRDNARQLTTAIETWRSETVAQMGDRQPLFITDHVFTSHFETDMGYPPIATIHDHHDDHGGLWELGKIEDRLRRQPANCLLTLESSPSPLALELAQKYHLRVISLSSTQALDSQQPAIIQRLQRLALALYECS
jgi:zinc transport system substrate-binding protein